MAQSVDHQRSSYPLPVYNFRVSIDGKSMSFAEVSGLEREHQVVVYRHGLSSFEGEQLLKFYVDKFASITLKRGTVVGAADASWLYHWLEHDKPRSLQIELCDASGAGVIRWQVAKAYAVKLTAPSFDAKSNEVSVETLEVKAAGVTVKDLSD